MGFEFLSFWLLGPEVITQILNQNDDVEWLIPLERFFEGVLRILLKIVDLFARLLIGLLMSVFNVTDFKMMELWYSVYADSKDAVENAKTVKDFFNHLVKPLLIIVLIFILIPGIFFLIAYVAARILGDRFEWLSEAAFVYPMIAVITTASGLIYGLLMYLVFLIRLTLRKLADDRGTRRRAFIIGAILFVLGSTMQCVSTF
jgi:hypothetical protein